MTVHKAMQYKRGIHGSVREWHYLPCEERFMLYGLPEEKLPKLGQHFPTVAEALDMLVIVQTIRELRRLRNNEGQRAMKISARKRKVSEPSAL